MVKVWLSKSISIKRDIRLPERVPINDPLKMLCKSFNKSNIHFCILKWSTLSVIKVKILYQGVHHFGKIWALAPWLSKLTFISYVEGFSYHISNPKSFDRRFLSQNPSIGVNNVHIFTSLILRLVWWSLTPLQMQVMPGSSVSSSIFHGFFFLFFSRFLLFWK